MSRDRKASPRKVARFSADELSGYDSEKYINDAQSTGQFKLDSMSADPCRLTIFIVASFIEARATIPHAAASAFPEPFVGLAVGSAVPDEGGSPLLNSNYGRIKKGRDYG